MLCQKMVYQRHGLLFLSSTQVTWYLRLNVCNINSCNFDFKIGFQLKFPSIDLLQANIDRVRVHPNKSSLFKQMLTKSHFRYLSRSIKSCKTYFLNRFCNYCRNVSEFKVHLKRFFQIKWYKELQFTIVKWLFEVILGSALDLLQKLYWALNI